MKKQVPFDSDNTSMNQGDPTPGNSDRIFF